MSMHAPQSSSSEAAWLGRERDLLSQAARSSSLTAFGIATAVTATACAIAYGPIADRLTLAGAEATLIFVLLALAGLPIIALTAIIRPRLWRGKVRDRLGGLAKARFLEQYLAAMQPADAQRFNLRERSLIEQMVDAERQGQTPNQADYARAVELIIVYPIHDR